MPAVATPPPDPPPAVEPRGLRWWWPCVPLAGLLGLTAVLAVPRHVQAGDAGEFATVMLAGGIPHPSGYPWMRMLGGPARALAGLGVPPATAAALPCALAGVAAWIVLWPLLARWSGRGPATVAVAVLATASPVLVHASDSEVFGPHLLACALVLRLCARRSPRPWQLGLGLGLAVSHHLTAALLLPVVVGAAWPRPLAIRRLLVIAAQGLGAGLVGLVPYATLAIGSGGAWRWGDTRSAAGLSHHVLRSDYGVLSLSLHPEDPAVLELWARAIAGIGSAASGGLAGGALASVLVLGAVAALAVLARPRLPAVAPGVLWGLVGSMLASTLVFPAAQNIDPTSPFGAWILERFDLLSILLWAPAWSLAAAALWARMPGRMARGALGLAAVTLVATQLARSHARGLPSSDAGVERYAEDLLRTPEPDTDAIVIGSDDHRVFPILFVQHVLGHGRRTLYVDASLLSYPWYREHLRARFPALPDVGKPLALVGALWAAPALRDTPIYLANVFSRPAATELRLVPQGVLWRVLPPHRPPPTAAQLVGQHLAALSRYEPPPPPAHHDAHPWTDDLAAAYNEGTLQLLAALHADGRDSDARALLEALGPWRPPTR